MIKINFYLDIDITHEVKHGSFTIEEVKETVRLRKDILWPFAPPVGYKVRFAGKGWPNGEAFILTVEDACLDTVEREVDITLETVSMDISDSDMILSDYAECGFDLLEVVPNEGEDEDDEDEGADDQEEVEKAEAEAQPGGEGAGKA